MSIEVKIPKELTEYKATEMLGFNFRETISIIISVPISLLAFNILKSYMSLQNVTYIIILIDLPFLMFGFTTIKGLPFEKFIMLYTLNKIINPPNRYYSEIDIFDEINNEKEL